MSAATNTNGHANIIRHEEPRALASTMDPRGAIAPRNPDDVWRMAQTVAKSNLYGVKNVEEAMVRIATGMELGLSPMQSIRGVYVISAGGMSRPTLSADMMVAVVKNRPDLCKFFRMIESSDTIATYETQRIGEPSPVRMSYTIAQATRAGLADKGTWKQHPEAMLRARASSALARVVYPDVLNGLYDPSELEDIGADTRPAQTHVAEVVESRVVELTATEAQQAMEHGTSLDTPEERLAFWKSIADRAKAWPADDRRRVQAHFKSLDDAYKAAQATREPGEEG